MYSCFLSRDDDEGQFSDDEDISWKVRRGAVKCLEAVITTRREWILDSLRRISPALIARFNGAILFFDESKISRKKGKKSKGCSEEKCGSFFRHVFNHSI